MTYIKRTGTRQVRSVRFWVVNKYININKYLINVAIRRRYIIKILEGQIGWIKKHTYTI